jgi:methyl-accepting chemotaxis protein
MNILRRLNLSPRLSLLIAIFSVGFIIYGIWSFKTVNELKVGGPVYKQILQSKDLVADILPPPEYILESYLVAFQLSTTTSQTEEAELVKHLKELKATYDERHAYWLNEHLPADIADGMLNKTYQPAIRFYETAFQELIPAVTAQDSAAIDAAMVKLKTAYNTHLQEIQKLVILANSRADSIELSSEDQIQSATILLLLILTGSLGLGIIGAVFITRSITRPLHDAVQVATTVAAGDLSSQITTDFNDEPGQLLRALKTMNDNLSLTVGKVRTSADTIGTASREIASGNADLSARTEAQASSIEETVASMEQLTGTVRQNAENAAHASTLVNTTFTAATKGGEVVHDLIATMSTIKESSSHIADIITVIDGIAFQTNILALNAAVEAARAGEQGRGFAVVASEVRTLAQRSANAAKEIKALIEDSVNRVNAGNQLVDKTGNTMTAIVESVQQVNVIMSEIATASREQSAGINQVNIAITQMDQAAQQNAALVEEASAAATSMQDEARGLIEDVSVFKLANNSHSAVQAPLAIR